MKSKALLFPLSIILASSAIAGQFLWTGGTNDTWTTAANWNTSTSPPTTAGAELTYPAYGTNYTADNMRIPNGAGAGAVYNPGTALTTTFRNGRGIIIGAGSAGNLTITSGTLAAVFTTANSNGDNDPLMGNNANATLLINGGTLDVTGVQQSDGINLRPFQLVWPEVQQRRASPARRPSPAAPSPATTSISSRAEPSAPALSTKPTSIKRTATEF